MGEVGKTVRHESVPPENGTEGGRMDNPAKRGLRAVLVLIIMTMVWSLLVHAIVRGTWTESTVATTWFGMWGPPRLSVSATCRNAGHEAVWVAETGTDFLDIIQVGDQDGSLFYAYGRGSPGATGALYREVHLGPSGIGPHRYGLSLAARVWTLTIDGRTVARIPDTFRTWRLRQTQVMAEGDLPMGSASCSARGSWHFGGYGPQPAVDFGTNWWRIK